MAEYIEREKLLKDISDTVVFTVRKGTPLPTTEMRGANKVIDRIKSAPTADVVKVVRCRNCKHKVDALGITMCSRTAVKKGNGWFGLTAKEENHYCSYGELKEREG